MIGFAVRVFARSRRWLFPLTVLVSWILLQQPGGGPLRMAVPSALAMVFISSVSTVLLLNTDGDAHREILAAAMGGNGRLHRHRIAAALVVNLALCLPVTVWIVANAGTWSPAAAIEVLACLAGAAGLGTGWAALLGRPVTANPVVTLIGVVLPVPVLLFLPPVTSALRRLDAGHGLVAFGVAAVGALTLAAGVTLSAALADRRSTVRQL